MNSGLVKTETARVGRENQRYSPESGARMVAGCICLNEEKTMVVMISLAKHKGHWVFPKGGIELDEGEDFLVSAERETWEEAGCEGQILSKLPVVYDMRPKKNQPPGNATSGVPKSEFHFYEMIVSNVSSTWPESKERQRRWCTYAEAQHELERASRPELAKALEASTMVRGDVTY